MIITRYRTWGFGYVDGEIGPLVADWGSVDSWKWNTVDCDETHASMRRRCELHSKLFKSVRIH